MLLANCTSWQAPALFPGTTAPGSPPAGWKPAQAGTPLTGVGMYGYRCARIHVGPFERGPIYLLTDTHNNADMPANCTATREPTNFAVVSSFWIDDAAVGDYLNRTYGLPVVVGTFHEDTQTTQSLTAHVWSWTTAGKGSSKLTIYDDQTSMPAPINNDRLFWARDGGISSLELQYERSAPGTPLQNRGATGTLAPPMLLSTVAGGQYAGAGEWYPYMPQGVGTFTHYKDVQCLHPG